MSDRRLLEVEDLRTYFYTRRGVVKAVDGVSFGVGEGETLGVVGESGCGKTITGLSLLRLVPKPAGRIAGGKVLFDGEDLLQKSDAEMRRIRGAGIATILQDPMTSLNPVFTIGSQVGEAISLHQGLREQRLWERIMDMLRLVRVPSPEARVRAFPHELSGGMRQRVVGAIALSCAPRLLIADEPTTSLDLTIQAQYLDLLKEIQQRQKMAL
ncbi:MAG: ABC transporter ATP-binding protein, partial [Dehalococcoidia bacterium]|nr:ABC transporter ATP-binding protein [Dehalococcoidia bacterium]